MNEQLAQRRQRTKTVVDIAVNLVAALRRAGIEAVARRCLNQSFDFEVEQSGQKYLVTCIVSRKRE